jgi:DNA modification methylase
MLNEQSGERTSRATERDERPSTSKNGYGPGDEDGWKGTWHRSGIHFGDSGGASRFFYCAKASRQDRGEGNTHPTVKSTALMSWLVKLACPAGGLVLDPFAGSGSTGKAALATGRRFVGIEIDRAYYAIAQRRIESTPRPLFTADDWEG